MSRQKVRGIVIEARSAGESDKWLTVLCKDKGKITVKARGCRKPNSKLFACTALFAYCDFIIDDRLKFWQLSSGDIIRPFFAGCDDLDILSAANYFIKVTNRLIGSGQEDNIYMYFLLKAFQALDKRINDTKTIEYIFAVRALATAGFMPHLESCINCGSTNIKFFHPEGTLCIDCRYAGKIIPLLPETRTALIQIAATETDKLFRLKFSPQTLDQLSECARMMMNYYIDTNLNT